MFECNHTELMARVHHASVQVTDMLMAMPKPKSKPHRLSVLHEGRWMTVKQREALLASRREH
jgi:hypothetical protein